MPTAVIDGITTRYEIVGSGPPLLMYAPGGFNAVIEAWSTLGIYQITQLLPPEGDDFQYKIKSAAEPHERVAKESQLDRIG